MKRVFTPTKRITKGASLYRKWSEWQTGDILIARYISTTVDKKYGKLGRVVEVIEADFKDGSGPKYVGQTLTLNQTGKLHKALENEDFGIVFQLVYKGKTEITGGPHAGSEANDMDIDIGSLDDEDVDL